MNDKRKGGSRGGKGREARWIDGRMMQCWKNGEADGRESGNGWMDIVRV